MFSILPPRASAAGRPAPAAWLGRCGAVAARSTAYLVGGVSELCYPAVCVLCHGPLGAEFPPECPSLCSGCHAILLATAAEAACERCARPQPPVTEPEPEELAAVGLAESAASGGTSSLEAGLRLCPLCRRRRTAAISQAVALGMYRDVMREAVIAAKRLSYQPLALALGQLLGHRVRDVWGASGIGAVTYIPSHWSRRWSRRGCPTQLLAAQVGRIVGVPVVPILRTVRRTAKQGTLSDKGRRSNVRGAFGVKKGYALLAPRVLVVDDVWTTGATLQEAAGVIRQGYDAEVFAAVIARAIGTHDG